MFGAKTIKKQITLLVSAFTIFVSILVIFLGIFFIYTTQRRTSIHSTEFSLRLVSSLVEQDLINLTALVELANSDSDIIDYLESTKKDSLANNKALHKLQQEYRNNRSSRYIERILIFSTDRTKILQLGTGLSTSHPITQYNISLLDSYIQKTPLKWDRLIMDPFFLSDNHIVVPYLIPLISPNDKKVIGYVFLSANPAFITDKLQGYSINNGSLLNVTLGENNYALVPGSSYHVQGRTSHIFTDITPEEHISLHTNNKLIQGVLDPKTAAYNMKQDGRTWLSVSYPITEFMTINEMIPTSYFLSGQTIWMFILFCVILLILLFSTIITSLMERKINTPILELKKRMALIGKGDFSLDESINLDNELGEIGRGINQLTTDINALLEKRLYDEKKKKDLEYQMLQSQINPHFLYNTLSSIKWMAMIQNAEGIAEMTTALSHLMRSASKDTRKMVPINDELKTLDDYMLIQHYRYGGSIKLVKTISDETLLRVEIPRFSLQPLVENAIFHGIEPKGSGVITVTVTSDSKDVLISILDDGVGMTSDILEAVKKGEQKSPSMFRELGIHAIDSMMKYAFGAEYGIMVNSKENKYTETIICVPLNAGEPTK